MTRNPASNKMKAEAEEVYGMQYYVISCVFTERFPEMSLRIAREVADRYGLEPVRCCVPGYKVREFEERMPAAVRGEWASIRHCAAFRAGDTVWSLCHNCSNIIEETCPGVQVRSIWERLADDPDLPLPRYAGAVIVQDCWRARERAGESRAVRALLDRMGMEVSEAPGNGAQTRFCGVSLYRPQPPRNPRLAPKHYVEGCEGLFEPHSEDTQLQLMQEHCRRFEGRRVVCSCHYCLEGLRLGGADAVHIAELVFPAG